MALIECPECKTQVSDAATACPKCGYPIANAALAAPAAAAAPASPGGARVAVEERELWRGHPSLLVLTPTFLRGGAVAVVAVAAMIYRYSLADAFGLEGEGRGSFVHSVSMGAWTLLLATVLYVAWRVIVIKCYRYMITSQRVRWERGVVSRAVDEIDLRLVDDTSFRQGILQRLFRIGDVDIRSHDTDRPDFHLRGVRDPRRIREMVRAEAYAVSQRSLFMRQA
jgi:uncharacterized membrane protein YdbT with pleckstrin-like domain